VDRLIEETLGTMRTDHVNGDARASESLAPVEGEPGSVDRALDVAESLARTTRLVASGRGAWPHVAPEGSELPRTLPGGRPWPRITVVTPSFNQGRYIEETILSVRNQRYPNLEHIVMDGGSTDGTRDILHAYRDGFAHWQSEPDGGQSDAINSGFARSTGEILTWLNSDDQLAPGALAAVALAFVQSGADLVAGECHIYRDGKLVDQHLTSCADGPLPLEDLLDISGRWLEGQFFYQPEVMFTRAIWERAGAHVRTDLYHSMDYDLWLRMAHAGARLHVIGRPVARFRFHEQQKTATDVVGGFRAELPRARDAFIARTAGDNGTVEARTPRAAPLRSRLRVALFNDLGFAYGAGIAHRRLAEALASAGHEVRAVAASTSEHHGDAAPKITREAIVSTLASVNPDLVIVGNLHGANVDPAALSVIASRWPTAFVMHDLWALTGRCAYTGGCNQYLTGCGAKCSCPRVHPKLAAELVGPAWKAKRNILGSAANLALWANSDWALQKAREALPGASLAGPAPQTIKFGFELETFAPRDKMACRDLLGLPRDRFIIMSSASSVADPRKGLAHLARAMELLKLDDALVTAVGWFSSGEEPPIPGMRAMGYMKDAQRLALLYSAADLFVGPSLEEAFGQVYIEAAACGTPSVGYPVGGKPEAIRDGLSGRLAKTVNPEALAEAIDELYRDPALRADMARWGRLWVESEYSMHASYHRMLSVLKAQGFAERLGLAPKMALGLHPRHIPEPRVVPGMVPGWRAISGFDHWEGPYPHRKLPHCRWAHGPVARFEIHADAEGPAKLLIKGRCYLPGQRVKLVHNHVPVGERDIPSSGGGADQSDRVISFDVTLSEGANQFDLHFWEWQAGPRPMAFLTTAITAVAVGARAAPVSQAK
jgi:glycosyltransferase involved in cell wall biosynthesis